MSKTSLFDYREAKSEIAATPLIDGVLIKQEYIAGVTEIVATESPRKALGFFSVAGYGTDTKELEIGDAILFEFGYVNSEKLVIGTIENTNSRGHWHRAVKELSSEQLNILRGRNSKFIVVEYLIIPMHAIKGIVKKDTKEWQIVRDMVMNPSKEKITNQEIKERFSL